MEPKLPHTQTSLFRCARKGGREGDNGLRPPSVPFPSSLAVHHQSLAFRARLRHAKNEAPEEELEPKCVPQLFLGLSFGTCGPAIVFSLSLVTIPEVFAKLSWFLKPSIPLRSSLITNLQLWRSFLARLLFFSRVQNNTRMTAKTETATQATIQSFTTADVPVIWTRETEWRLETSRLRQTANVRFNLSNFQNKKWADKNSSKQLLWIELAWIYRFVIMNSKR